MKNPLCLLCIAFGIFFFSFDAFSQELDYNIGIITNQNVLSDPQHVWYSEKSDTAKVYWVEDVTTGKKTTLPAIEDRLEWMNVGENKVFSRYFNKGFLDPGKWKTLGDGSQVQYSEGMKGKYSNYAGIPGIEITFDVKNPLESGSKFIVDKFALIDTGWYITVSDSKNPERFRFQVLSGQRETGKALVTDGFGNSEATDYISLQGLLHVTDDFFIKVNDFRVSPKGVLAINDFEVTKSFELGGFHFFFDSISRTYEEGTSKAFMRICGHVQLPHNAGHVALFMDFDNNGNIKFVADKNAFSLIKQNGYPVLPLEVTYNEGLFRFNGKIGLYNGIFSETSGLNFNRLIDGNDQTGDLHQFATVPDNDALKLDSFTMQVLVKPLKKDRFGQMICMKGDYGYGLMLDNNGYLYFIDGDQVNRPGLYKDSLEYTPSLRPIRFGYWSNVVVTVKNGKGTYYIDGQEAGSFTLKNERNLNNNGELFIGRSGCPSCDDADKDKDPCFFFNGAMSGLTMWNRTLSPSEIQSINNNEAMGSLPGKKDVILNFQFLQKEGSTLSDNSGNHNGTLHNNPHWINDYSKIFDINNLQYDSTGLISAPEVLLTGNKWKIGSFNIVPTSVKFADGNLVFDGNIDFGYTKADFKDLTIDDGGNYTCDNLVPNPDRIDIKGFTLDNLNLKLDTHLDPVHNLQDYRITAGGKINLPQGLGTVPFQNFHFNSNGTVEGNHFDANDSLKVKDFMFTYHSGVFYPHLKYYEIKGTVENPDAVMVELKMNDVAIAHVPVFDHKWSYEGVRAATLDTITFKARAFYQKNDDGSAKIYDGRFEEVTSTIVVTEKSGNLIVVRGGADVPNGSLITVLKDGKEIGKTIAWAKTWTLSGFNLPTDLSRHNVTATAEILNFSYTVSGSADGNDHMVVLKQGIRDEAIVPVVDEKWQCTNYFTEHLDEKLYQAYGYSDHDNDNRINLHSQSAHQLGYSIDFKRNAGKLYTWKGHSRQPNGAIVQLTGEEKVLGYATVWDHDWEVDAVNPDVSDKTVITAKVFAPDGLGKKPLEDVSKDVTLTIQDLNHLDVSDFIDVDHIPVSADSSQNVRLYLNGDYQVNNFGRVATRDLTFLPTGIASSGEYDKSSTRFYNFDGFSMSLSYFDMDMEDDEFDMEGEVMLPDNTGSIYAELVAKPDGINLKKVALLDPDVTFGKYQVKLSTVEVNRDNEFVFKGKLEFPFIDKEFPIESLVYDNSGKFKSAVVSITDMQDYTFIDSFKVTLDKILFTPDSVKVTGLLDMDEFGKFNISRMLLNEDGFIEDADMEMTSGSLMLHGYDLGKDFTKLYMKKEHIVVEGLKYKLANSEVVVDIGFITIDKKLNITIDDVKITNGTLSFQGFDIEGDALTWNGSSFLLGGKINLGNKIGFIEVDSILLNKDGSITGGKYDTEATHLTIDGFKFLPDSIDYNRENKVFNLHGDIVLPDGTDSLQLSKYIVTKDSVISTGIIQATNKTISWNHFGFLIDSISLIKDHLTMDGSIMIDGLGKIFINKAMLNPNGDCFGGVADLHKSGLNLNVSPYHIKIDSIDFEDNKIEGSGSVIIPGGLGSIHMKNYDILSNDLSNASFKYNSGNKEWQFNGLPLAVRSVLYTGKQFKIFSSVTLPNNMGTCSANFSMDTTFNINLDEFKPVGNGIKYAGYNVALSRLQFQDNKFSFDGKVSIGNMGYYNIQNVSLDAAGSISGGAVSADKSEWQWGVSKLALNQVTMTPEKIMVDASLSLPMGAGVIKIKDLVFDTYGNMAEGSIDVKGSSLTYSGYTLVLDSAYIFNNINFGISAHILLPGEYGEIAIADLVINKNAEILIGSVAYKGKGIKDGAFGFDINNVAIDKNAIKMDGVVDLPSSVKCTRTVTFTGLSVTSAGVQVDKISALNTSFILNGYKFNINDISWNFQNKQMILNGMLSLPSSMGEIETDSIAINSNGSISSGTIKFKGISFDYHGYTLVPLSITFQGPDIALDGEIYIPQGLGVLSVKQMIINPGGIKSQGVITAKTAEIKWNGYVINPSEVVCDDKGITINGSVLIPGLGTLVIKNALINRNGVPQGGEVALETDKVVKIFGYPVEINKINFLWGAVEVSGKIPLPDMKADLLFKPIKLDSKGNFSGSFIYSGDSIPVDDKFYIKPIQCNIFNNSLRLTVSAYNSNNVLLGKIDDVEIKAGKVKVSKKEILSHFGGIADKANQVFNKITSYSFGGFSFDTDTTNYTSTNDTVTTNGKFTVPVLGDVLLNGIKFNSSNFKLVKAPDIVIPSQGCSIGGAKVTIAGISLEDGHLVLSGGMTFPNGLPPMNIDRLVMSSHGEVIFASFDLSALNLKISGYNFKPVAVIYSNNTLNFDGLFEIGPLGKLAVGQIEYNLTTGQFSGGKFAYAGTNFKLPDLSSAKNSPGTKEQGGQEGNAADNTTDNGSGYDYAKLMKLVSSGNASGSDDKSTPDKGKSADSDFSFLNVWSFSSSSGSGLPHPDIHSPDLNLGGFRAEVENVNMDWQNNKLLFDGIIILPDTFGKNNRIRFREMQVSPDGQFDFKSIDASNVELTYKGYGIIIDSAIYLKSNQTVSVNGRLAIPHHSNTLFFKNFIITSDGKIKGGELQLASMKLEYKGFELELEKASLDLNFNLTLSGSIAVPPHNFKVHVEDAKYNPSGFRDYGKISASTDTIKWKDYFIKIDKISFEENSFVIDGIAGLASLGTLTAKRLTIDTQGHFKSGEIDLATTKTISHGGFTIGLTRAGINNSGIVADGFIDFKENRRVDIKNATLTYDGKLAGGEFSYSGPPIMFYGTQIFLQNIQLLHNGIQATAIAILPDSLATVIVKDMAITYPMNVKIKDIEVNNVHIHYDGMVINLDSARYDMQNLILNGNIENEMLGTITARGLILTPEGRIIGGETDYSKTINYGSVTVDIRKLGFNWKNKFFTVAGTVILPSNTGTLSIDSLEIDSHDGHIIYGALSAQTGLSYGGAYLKDAKAIISNNLVELSATAELPNKLGTISISGLDLNVSTGKFSGGTFGYIPGDPIVFGSCKVEILKVLMNLEMVDVSARITLPAGMGLLIAKDAKFQNGKFVLEELDFMGQHMVYKGFSVEVKKGVIKHDGILMDLECNVSGEDGEIIFAINNLGYANGEFHGGEFSLDKSKIIHNGFVLEIFNSETIRDNSACRFDAKLTLPQGNYTTLHHIILGEHGLDLSEATMGYEDLMSLLPPMFNLKITEHQFVPGGFEVSGSIMVAEFSFEVKGLKITNDKIDIEGIALHTPSLKVAGYDFENLDFAFAKDGKDWMIHANGTINLGNPVQGISGFTMDGTLHSNGNFDASMTADGTILIGSTGIELQNPGGGIIHTSSSDMVKIWGTFAPVKLEHVLKATGELDITFDGKIRGKLDPVLYDMIPLDESTCFIDIPNRIFTLKSTFGIQDIIYVDADLDIKCYDGFIITGKGDMGIGPVKLGDATLLIDKNVFNIKGWFVTPGNPCLVKCEADVKMDFTSRTALMKGDLRILDYPVGSADFVFSKQALSGKGKLNMGFETFDLEFLASRGRDNYELQIFKGKGSLDIMGINLSSMEIDVDQNSWKGLATAQIPGMGSSIYVKLEGDKSGVSEFTGKFGYTFGGFHLAQNDFTYKRSSGTISLSSYCGLAHIGRTDFDITLANKSNTWYVHDAKAKVNFQSSIEIPVVNKRVHTPNVSTTLNYVNNSFEWQGPDIDLSLVDANFYVSINVKNGSVSGGAKGSVGLGYETLYFYKPHIHCHRWFHCHTSWEKCCKHTINLGRKNFNISF